MSEVKTPDTFYSYSKKKSALFLLFACLFPADAVIATELKLTQGGHYKLCKEVAQTLKAPQNKEFELVHISQTSGIDFSTAPKKIKEVKWASVSEDGLNTLITETSTKSHLEKLRETAIRVGESSQNDQLVYEKIEVPLTNNKTIYPVLRVRMSNWKIGHCILPDTAPKAFKEYFNRPASFGLIPIDKGCQVFAYDNRFYTASSYITLDIREYKESIRASKAGTYPTLTSDQICSFHNNSVQ